MAEAGEELRRLQRVYRLRRERHIEDRYTPFEPANLFRLQSLERALAGALRRRGCLPWGERRALDVGCGGGWWLRTLLRWGARPEQLAGIDVLPEAVNASRLIHPSVLVARASAHQLPFPDGSFDLVSQFTVLSSILDEEMRRRVIAEMRRVLRPGGLLLWYDFTVNPTNRDTRGISAREAARHLAGSDRDVRRVTLAPPLTRLVAPRSWLAAEILDCIPLLRSHILLTARI